MKTVDKNRERTALVITSRNNHIIAVQPVIEELRKRNWKVITLRLEKIWERVESVIRTIKKSMASVQTKEPPTRRVYILKEKLYGLFAKLISGLISTLRVKKPRIFIVMTDGPLPERIAVLAGKSMNVPSLLLQVGAIGPKYRCSELLVDKIAVMGPFSRDIYIKSGVDPAKLVVTGRPAYDRLARADEFFDEVKIYNRLGLDQYKKTIVWTTQTHGLSPEENRKNISAVFGAMKSLENIQLVIKLHPAEDQHGSLYRKSEFEPLILGKETDTSELLYVSDVVLTKHSTTAIEAMILNKPVITMNFSGGPDPMPYAESGAAIGVYREEDLARAIKNALYDKEAREKLRKARKKFYEQHSYEKDGKATERVVELIERIIKED